jgi:hypothetical protein
MIHGADGVHAKVGFGRLNEVVVRFGGSKFRLIGVKIVIKREKRRTV